MALQGTIDAFPVSDVIGLLATSRKTGRLLVEGNLGSTSLWVRDGALIGFDAPSGSPVSAIATLLRHSDATFVFEAVDDEAPPTELLAVPLLDCLAEAGEVVEQWRRIERVVPSVQHRVSLIGSIQTPVTIEPDLWGVLVRIADRPSVAELGADLGLDDLEVSAAVYDLAASGMVEVTGPAAVEPAAQVSAAAQISLTAVAGPGDAFPDHFPIDDLVSAADEHVEPAWQGEPAAAKEPLVQFDVAALSPDTPVPDVATPAASAAAATPTQVQAPAGNGVDSTDEVFRQMAQLSPQAADAIAAALGSDPVGATGGEVPSAEEPPASTTAADATTTVSYLQSF